jgi:hypothetical protein
MMGAKNKNEEFADRLRQRFTGVVLREGTETLTGVALLPQGNAYDARFAAITAVLRDNAGDQKATLAALRADGVPVLDAYDTLVLPPATNEAKRWSAEAPPSANPPSRRIDVRRGPFPHPINVAGAETLRSSSDVPNTTNPPKSVEEDDDLRRTMREISSLDAQASVEQGRMNQMLAELGLSDPTPPPILTNEQSLALVAVRERVNRFCGAFTVKDQADGSEIQIPSPRTGYCWVIGADGHLWEEPV